jgi:hypothetical protein
MSGSIRLSQKHGVNPSVMLCFVCNESYGVALLGKLRGDAEAPRQGVYERTPCAKCKDLMKRGVVLISVRDGEETDTPYRTGGWCVVRDEAIARMITTPELRDVTLHKRLAFVPDAVWDALGLPRGEGDNESASAE